MKKLVMLGVFFTAMVFAGTFTTAQAFDVHFPGFCDGFQLTIAASTVGGTHTSACGGELVDASGSVAYFFTNPPFPNPDLGLNIVGGRQNALYIFNFTTMTVSAYSAGSGTAAPTHIITSNFAFAEFYSGATVGVGVGQRGRAGRTHGL